MTNRFARRRRVRWFVTKRGLQAQVPLDCAPTDSARIAYLTKAQIHFEILAIGIRNIAAEATGERRVGSLDAMSPKVIAHKAPDPILPTASRWQHQYPTPARSQRRSLGRASGPSRRRALSFRGSRVLPASRAPRTPTVSRRPGSPFLARWSCPHNPRLWGRAVGSGIHPLGGHHRSCVAQA